MFCGSKTDWNWKLPQRALVLWPKEDIRSAIREEMISHDDALRAQKNNRIWNTLITIGFVIAIMHLFLSSPQIQTDLSFMQPDYPKKLFPDQREHFVFLLEMLASISDKHCQACILISRLHFYEFFLNGFLPAVT